MRISNIQQFMQDADNIISDEIPEGNQVVKRITTSALENFEGLADAGSPITFSVAMELARATVVRTQASFQIASLHRWQHTPATTTTAEENESELVVKYGTASSDNPKIIDINSVISHEHTGSSDDDPSHFSFTIPSNILSQFKKDIAGGYDPYEDDITQDNVRWPIKTNFNSNEDIPTVICKVQWQHGQHIESIRFLIFVRYQPN